MTIINEWVYSESNTHFKNRTEIHHIYKLDTNRLTQDYPHLGWCFNQFPIKGLDNQTMTFDYYKQGRESYNFFRLSDTKMVLIHKTLNGNQDFKLVRFDRSIGTSGVCMEVLYSERIDLLDAGDIRAINSFIKLNTISETPKKIYVNKNFNFVSKKEARFKNLKGRYLYE